MSSVAAVQRKPQADKANAKPKEGAAHDNAAIGSPAFLGGIAGGGGAPPVFLQRAPMDIVAEDEPDEATPDATVQRLPQDPFPNGDDEDQGDPILQAKLEINTPGDPFEHEADSVASAVTSGGTAPDVSAGKGAPTVQRKCASCGDDHEGGGTCPRCAAKLQRAETTASTPKPTASAAQAVVSPGAGAPLAPDTRKPIESELGSDLSQVRVHSDTRAQEAAGSIDAKAFTHGNHIWLGAGQSASDLELMAHEATHTVQQGAGNGGPALIQRAPADHMHAEDAAAPRARMEGELAKEKEEKGERDEDEPVPEIDPAEKRAKSGPLVSKAKPDADRPALEAPKVDQAANTVKQEADAPTEELVAGQSDAPQADGGTAEEPPAPAVNPVDDALAQVSALPEPEAPPPIEAPPIAQPVDGDGQPLPPEAQAEAMVQALAAQLQVAREAAFGLRRKAKQQKANAIVLRGNIALADQHIAEAETGLTTAHGHMETRREVLAEADNAHATSEQKAETVAADAPGVQAEAEEAQGESGPMASEASDTAAQNDANAPDDADAAADSAESGAQMNSVASDSASMDQAASATRERAVLLQSDAATAKTKNAEAKTTIAGAAASADQTDGKLVEMDGQTTTARSEVEPLKGKPDEAQAQAIALEAQAEKADQKTDAMAVQLHQVQADYVRDMGRVPGSDTLAEQNEGAIQRTETDGAPTAGTADGPATAFAPRGYEGRRKVDLPTFQMGPPLTDEQREKQAAAAAAAEARRRARIEALQNGSHGNFGDLTAVDKAGIALDFMMEDAFSSASNIKWPDFSAGSVGKALLNIIDPRGPLNGIMGGLSKVASGTLNLFDMDQWAQDPLGNLLKSAADIATGITVILGSIVALLGVVVAISAALIVLSWFTLAPALTPVIAWCTSAGMTVGGWTISVGLLALYYQSLLIIKNIVDVMTAETAEELVINTEQMGDDFSQVGEIGMQMGTAYLGAKGGPGMLDDIATKGMRTVATQEVMQGLQDAAIEVVAGEDISGVIGVARMAHGVHSHARGGGGGGDGPRADDGSAPRPEGADAAPPAADAAGPAQAPDAPTADAPAADGPPAAATPVEAPTPNAQPAMEGGPPPQIVDGPAPQPRADMDADAPPPAEPRADATSGTDADATTSADGGDAAGPAPAPTVDGGSTVQRPDAQTDMPQAGRSDAESDAGAGAPRPDTDGPAPDGTTSRPDGDEGGTQPRPDADDPAAQAGLRESAGSKRLDDMSPAERRAEATQANAAPRQEITNPNLRDIDFDQVAHLDNGMDYITSDSRGSACRVANTGCGPTDADGNVAEGGLTGDARTEADVDVALADGTPTPDTDSTPRPPEADADPAAESPATTDTPQSDAEAPNADMPVDATLGADDAGASTPDTPTSPTPDAEATPGDGVTPGDADASTPAIPPTTAPDGLPAQTGNRDADIGALEGRPVTPQVEARMRADGYFPRRNAAGEIIAFRRPNGNPDSLPEVTVTGGEISRVRPEVDIIIQPGHGRNTATFRIDPTSGRPISVEATLRDDAGGHDRGDNATEVGNLEGNAADDGGHLIAHRFMSDTIDGGIVPQSANLNRGAWKTMENEIAGWIAYGRSRGTEVEVRMEVRVDPPGAVRPDRFEGQFSVVEVMPDGTRHVRRVAPIGMDNVPGQTFDRVYFDTDASGVMHERS